MPDVLKQPERLLNEMLQLTLFTRRPHINFQKKVSLKNHIGFLGKNQ